MMRIELSTELHPCWESDSLMLARQSSGETLGTVSLTVRVVVSGFFLILLTIEEYLLSYILEEEV